MNVIIEPGLFAPGSSERLSLLGVFRLGVDGRHTISVDRPEDPQFQAWLSGLDNQTREECEFALARSTQELTNSSSIWEVRVVVGSSRVLLEGQRLVVSIDRAIELLHAPFKILVENSESDRAFLLALARMEWRDKLVEWEGKRWLEFDHGGGVSTIPRMVRQTASSPGARTRCFVVFDSDALAPEKPSEASAKLTKLCQKKHVKFHRLMRRAIENYIPLAALGHWAEHEGRRGERGKDRTRTYRALRKMRTDQQHHYNLKAGFDGDAKRTDRSNADGLYTGLEATVKGLLAHGFGEEVWTILNWANRESWEGWVDKDGVRSEMNPVVAALFSCL
jgi:hypothetical protein